jgi:hypothetical protein
VFQLRSALFNHAADCRAVTKRSRQRTISTTAKLAHHLEPSFTAFHKRHAQRLIHCLANDHRRSQTFSEVVERNGRLNVMRSACAAVRIGEAGADGKKCGIDAELNDEG